MSIPPSVSEQTYQYFVQEATELLQVMEEELQDVKQNFSLQKVYTLMRAAHTLKGASASVGLDNIQKATHSLEDIFKALCYDDTVINDTVERLIFEGYECVRLLMSAQLVGTQVDGDETLNRMAGVIDRLQTLLGDRMGQGGRLPSSSELGFDMTQSIFEMGVTQRLETLEAAIKESNPKQLRALLTTQAEIFMGLGESLNLPGFEAIAKTTHNAIQQYPDLVLHIAPVALANFKAARTDVLNGDRTQGGLPSIALQQFGGQFDANTLPAASTNTSTNPAVSGQSSHGQSSKKSGQSHRRSWLKRQWQLLTRPIGTATANELQTHPSRQTAVTNSRAHQTSSNPNGTTGTGHDPAREGQPKRKVKVKETQSNSAQSNGANLNQAEPTAQSPTQSSNTNGTHTHRAKSAADSDLLELTPSELEGFNLQDLPNSGLPSSGSPLPASHDHQAAAANDSAANSSPTNGLPSGTFGQLAPNLDGLAPINVYEESATAASIPEQSLNPQTTGHLFPNPETKLASNISATEPNREQGSATIRISTDHLEKLDQAMGELLTQQNRQTLYNEQLTTLIKKLLNRISTQQQQLNHQQTEYLIRKTLPSALSVASPTISLSTPTASSQPKSSQLESSQAEKDIAAPPLEAADSYNHFDTIELERYSDIQLLLQSCLEETIQQTESAEAIELFVKQSEQAIEKQKRLLANTRETLLEARMVPLATIFQQFPAVIERLRAQHQKLADLTIEGGEILVDKAIADQLYEPLLHLVRNAFDHGIESPEERLDQNKPFTGNITLEGKQRGRHLIINVTDDGQGIDLDAIRASAVTNQLITQETADSLTAEQTTDLLFEPGFSTTLVPDTLSGRGIGLEAVRAKVQALQGWINVSHQPERGTCFTLHIPTNLTIAKLLLCQAQGRIYALIADAVEHILIPTDQQIRTWKGGKVLTWQANKEEYLVSVSVLNEVLNYASPMSAHQPSYSQTSYLTPFNPHDGRDQRPAQHTRNNNLKQKPAANPVILLRQQNTLVGLEVDQLLGEQELVISPLGKTIAPPAYLYGSSTLPDGQLTLVLDGLRLAKIMIEQRKNNRALSPPEMPAPSNSPPKNKPIFAKQLILTVDDSITVRNTLAEALKKANYQVIQARDGEEALQQLERFPEVQAILCDIEMPGMNGFEFLKARQKTPAIAQIPTIMLTSRMGKKHRLLTEELGAIAYLTKPYLTPQLLKVVAEAIESTTQPTLSPSAEPQNQSSPPAPIKLAETSNSDSGSDNRFSNAIGD